MVAEGRFREDLYFRLAGIELLLPPLRDRQDRAELIRQVLADEGLRGAVLTPAAWDLLMRHPWPGNVRQLQYVLRTAVALADGATLTPEHLPALRAPGTSADAAVQSEPLAPEQAQERQALLEALEAARWNVSKVSKGFGVSRNTLYRRMHRLQIPVTHSG